MVSHQADVPHGTAALEWRLRTPCIRQCHRHYNHHQSSELQYPLAWAWHNCLPAQWLVHRWGCEVWAVQTKVKPIDHNMKVHRQSKVYLLTYSMVQSPSWEANWFAASQEIPCIWASMFSPSLLPLFWRQSAVLHMAELFNRHCQYCAMRQLLSVPVTA